MSLAESPSPVPSSSSGSDDFAALLDAELDLASAADSANPSDPSASPATDDEDEEEEGQPEEDVKVETLEQNGTKRRRVEEQHEDQATSVRPHKGATDMHLTSSPHFQVHLKMFKLRYVHTLDTLVDFSLGVGSHKLRKMFQELLLVTFTSCPCTVPKDNYLNADRLRGSDLKNLLRERKLALIIDLDHTLIKSTKLHDISAAENELRIQTVYSKDDPNRSIFTLESIQMLTKLRPFVNKFLKEASNMFEMYIYTMGDSLCNRNSEAS